MKFYNHIDLNKAEIRNAAAQVLASAPGTPVAGQFYYDSAAKQFLVYDTVNGWGLVATDSPKLNGNAGSYYLARANHTGTQIASTISDLAATVQAYRLDQFAQPTTTVSMNGNRLISVGDPVNPQDAATKNWVQSQVDNAAAGIDSKPSVRVIATSNITLSGTQTIDGVSLAAGDRVLVAAQSTATQNGVYVVGSGAWQRATDADQTGEITPGSFWFVEEGTTYGKTQWRCNNTGTITIGTTAITIVQFGAANLYTASTGLTLVGSDFRVNLASSSGLSTTGGLSIDTSVVARKYSTTIGDGSATSFTVTHGLGTTDVVVQVKEVSSGDIVWTNSTVTNTNAVTVSFVSAPSSSQFRVNVIG